MNPNATELIFLTPVLANKTERYVHTCSTTRNAPYVHPGLWRTAELRQVFAVDMTISCTLSAQ